MRLPVFALSCILAGSAHAACVAHSAPVQTHLVELYTSEGCSSCPPADAWLRGMHAGAQVQPLEWHVDYWDSLGWPDRFDDARYTARQRLLAAHGAGRIIYTPEVALDGREWRGWEHGALPANAPTAWSLALDVEPGSPLRVALRSTPAPAAYRAWFVVTEDGLASSVRAGENNGAVLRHAHTVRALAGPLPLARAEATLRLPPDLKPAQSAVVAFVQDPATGAVAQVVRQPLAQCRR